MKGLRAIIVDDEQLARRLIVSILQEMPEVEVIVMPSGGFWGGIGEPTIAVAAPAVLNAIFAATGKRIRRFPLSGTDLRPA